MVKTHRIATLYGRNGHAHAQMTELSTKYAVVISQRGAKVGTCLEIEFEIPAFGEFKTLRLQAKVTESLIVNEGYRLTLEFENIDSESLLAIKDFIAYKKRLHETSLHHTQSASFLDVL
ncbi:PilZ domain-containing protein [Galenea microaerophila]